jgi:hypothetical protein
VVLCFSCSCWCFDSLSLLTILFLAWVRNYFFVLCFTLQLPWFAGKRNTQVGNTNENPVLLDTPKSLPLRVIEHGKERGREIHAIVPTAVLPVPVLGARLDTPGTVSASRTSSILPGRPKLLYLKFLQLSCKNCSCMDFRNSSIQRAHGCHRHTYVHMLTISITLSHDSSVVPALQQSCTSIDVPEPNAWGWNTVRTRTHPLAKMLAPCQAHPVGTSSKWIRTTKHRGLALRSRHPRRLVKVTRVLWQR